MSGALSKAWWLLALCGILDAMHASINLVMPSLPLTYRIFGSNSGAVRDMGMLALGAAACTIAAGLWSRGLEHSWLLSLHGLAMGIFGAIIFSPLVKGPLSFRPISVLFTVMAASVGAFALGSAKSEGRRSSGRWILLAAGAISMGFAVSFIVVGGFRIRLEPEAFFVWMSSYLALSAVFLIWLAVQEHFPPRPTRAI